MEPDRRKSSCIGVLALVPIVFLALATARAQAATSPDDAPLPVRVVLREVSGLMDKAAYDQAVAKLTAFRARGGPASADGRPDPRGYHHPLIDLALGNLYLLKQEPEPAKAPLRRVVSVWPERIDAWLNLAKACYESQAYAEAASCFAKAYEQASEKDPQYLYFSAVAHLLDKSYGQAVTGFERLFAAHPGQIKPEWRENFVQALLAADKPRRALPLVRNLAAQTAGDARRRWQELCLHLYLQLEMAPEARAYARQLVDDDPATAKWWKALAHVELAAANYTEALTALTIYGYLTPLTPEERKLWADLNLQLEIPAQAAPVYSASLALSMDRKTLEKLVSAYRQMGCSEEALAQLDRYGAADADPALLMLRADLLYAARRFGDAAGAYRRAARGDRQEAGKAWLMAGYAAWQSDDLESSRQAFREAARFSRHKQAALKAMRQLEAVN